MEVIHAKVAVPPAAEAPVDPAEVPVDPAEVPADPAEVLAEVAEVPVEEPVVPQPLLQLTVPKKSWSSRVQNLELPSQGKGPADLAEPVRVEKEKGVNRTDPVIKNPISLVVACSRTSYPRISQTPLIWKSQPLSKI